MRIGYIGKRLLWTGLGLAMGLLLPFYAAGSWEDSVAVSLDVSLPEEIVDDPGKRPVPVASIATNLPISTPPTSTPPCSASQISARRCQPREVSNFHLFSGNANEANSLSIAGFGTTEEILERGLGLAGASPVHLAVRGTASSNSIQCQWRGVARTPEQRESAIRLWLGLDENAAIPDASYLEALFTTTIEVVDPKYRETTKSDFTTIARGGLSTEYLFLTCYADYTVEEYLLGDGPDSLTLGYDRVGEARSYELYMREYEAGQFGEGSPQTQGEYEAFLMHMVTETEQSLADAIGGYESVLFLAPMGAHSAIAVEAWQVVAQWDLQEDENDVVNAVRYGAPEYDPEQTQTLANLEARIDTAATTDSFADKRLKDVDDLDDYYADIGAYDDITPDDGDTTHFTPAQPPEVPDCANGTAVTEPVSNRGLVYDCEVLLRIKDTLAGTATLDWAIHSAITGWEGITVEDVTVEGTTTSRVTKVDLSSKSLDGTIPADLGDLLQLTVLNLSSNSLTGDIPSKLGWLFNLEEIKLSGNSLTGCIPVELESVATNDLSSLSLLYCTPPAPETPTAGTLYEARIPLTWAAVSNTSKYRVEYRLRGPDGWTVDDDSLTTASHTVDWLTCASIYQFRVSAFGSGVHYAEEWSLPSPILATDTGACTPPTFDTSPDSFIVDENSTEVATVVAHDANPEDRLTGYVISGGEDRTKFVIEPVSGALSFVTAPNFESPGSADGSNVYIVGVTATSGEGARQLMGTQTITVTVEDVNEPPRFTRTSFSHPENTTEVVEMLASDEDDEVTGYVIAGGPDSHLFSIDPDSGILSFVSAPDYQRPRSAAQSNLYTIQVTATSATGDRELSTTKTITVQVVYVYVREIHVPIFNEGISATRTVPEDAILGTAVGDPVSATDPDKQRLEYRLSGADRRFFDVNPGTGQLSIAAPLDYETHREYRVWLKVRDSGGSSASTTVTIEVENVDELGAVSLSPTKVETGALVYAVLTDPDGSVSSTAWQWQTSLDGTA